MKAIVSAVGVGGKNDKGDIVTIIHLLSERKKDSFYNKRIAKIKIPDIKSKTLIDDLSAAIKQFQTTIQDQKKPDGLISPNGNTIYFLGGVRKSGKQIIADLGDQKLYAFDGSVKQFEFHCASGDSKSPTAVKPELFSIMRKHKDYRSRKYDAPMDYAMFFTYDGKAIHQSTAVAVTSFLKDMGMNYFGSHGCIRLSESDASKLFGWTPMNTPVFIDMD